MTPSHVTQSHTRNLDVLRSAAVLCVFIAHLGYAISGAEYNAIGGVGVALFFVHTSLVLMMSLERDRNWFGFYVRRIFRIYPLSTLTVAVILTLHIPRDYSDLFRMPPVGVVIENLTLTQNVFGGPSVSVPLWSLPWEVQMYAILPVLFFFLRSGRSTAAVLIATLAVRFAGLALGIRGLTALQYAPCFLAGVLAYKMVPG